MNSTLGTPERDVNDLVKSGESQESGGGLTSVRENSYFPLCSEEIFLAEMRSYPLLRRGRVNRVRP